MHSLQMIKIFSEDRTKKPVKGNFPPIGNKEALILQRLLNDVFPFTSTDKAFQKCEINISDFRKLKPV